MTTKQQQIITELKDNIGNGTGCILLDIAYFNKNAALEEFDFHIDNADREDIELNHRYPNSYYTTISKKIGRKISKIGYAHYLKLGERGIMLEVDVNKKTYTCPIVFKLTEEKPVCGLGIKIYEDGQITYRSEHKCEDGIGWQPDFWTNRKETGIKEVFHQFTTEIDFTKKKNDNFLCNNEIQLKAQRLEDLIL